MSNESQWYDDERALLEHVRHGRRATRARRQPRIEGYADLQELSRGGQGAVYRATQRSTHRTVAIKVLHDGAWANEHRRRRFEREIELIASLRHPNIVRLYDSGVTEGGYPYYVMDYIEGTGLDELLGADAQGDAWAQTYRGQPLDVRTPSAQSPPSQPLSVRTSLELLAKVCEAVSYAHQHGVIHRDLKPSNIRIDTEGEPYVLDFGLAKIAPDALAQTTESTISRTGDFMGSPPWASPEQAEGNPHGTDVRSDVYALGVVLFQTLTGQFPYPVIGGFQEVLQNIQTAEPLRPSGVRPELDREVDSIVLKCLAKQAEDRYQSAAELARDLRSYLAGEPIAARRDDSLYALRKTMQRYRHLVRAVSVAAALVLLGAILLTVLWTRAIRAVDQADQERHDAQLAAQDEAAARESAQREAKQARRISVFLTTVLTTPLEKGPDTPLADLLNEAAAELERANALSPEVDATLHTALGNAYTGIAHHPEAERHLLASYETWQRHAGDDDPRTQEAVRRLVQFYLVWDHPLEAEYYRARLIDATTPEAAPR